MDTASIAWPAPRADESAKVRRWRQQAREQFTAAGLPNGHEEHWRRANFGFVAPLAAGIAVVPSAVALVPEVLDGLGPFGAFTHLAFVDGRFTPALCALGDDDAVSISRLQTALRDGQPARAPLLPNAGLDGDLRLALLNHALGADGVHVVVHRDRAARHAIVLDHRGALQHDGVTAISHVLRLEPGAVATVVELHDERCTGLRTLLNEVRIELGAGSRLLHLRLTGPTHASHLVDTLVVDVGRDAQYLQSTLAAPARALRSTQSLHLAGNGASAIVRIGGIACGGADVDLRLLATHDADATRSEQTVHVLGARGRATVDSEALVNSGRRAIRSRQSLRAILLQPGCDVALRPRLAILSDDVDCRHGATTSAFSDEQLFYLRSRGLPVEQAQQLLAAAHLEQLFPGTGDAALDALVQERLHAALAAVVAVPDEATQ